MTEDGRLTATQRGELRERIDAARRRAAARLQALTRDFDDIVEASSDAARDDEHDPEGATIAFERQQVATLIADARATLEALDVAEARLDGPEGGRCERCGTAIGFERMLARPASTRCVACADLP